MRSLRRRRRSRRLQALTEVVVRKSSEDFPAVGDNIFSSDLGKWEEKEVGEARGVEKAAPLERR